MLKHKFMPKYPTSGLCRYSELDMLCSVGPGHPIHNVEKIIVGVESHKFVGSGRYCQGTLGYAKGDPLYGTFCGQTEADKIHQGSALDRQEVGHTIHDVTIPDSGERRNFSTGSVRDTTKGKGRFDLISPFAMKRLAIRLEDGASKYEARNWEKGIPASSFIDSAQRHINQYLQGDKTEDHLAAALWNIHALMHTEEMIKRGKLPDSLNDLPDYGE